MWDFAKFVWKWIQNIDTGTSLLGLYNNHQALQNACDTYAADPSSENLQAVAVVSG